MRIVFMGTPEFAVPTLRALLDAGHEVVAVYSQPPRRSGRGMSERPGPVHAFAADAGLTVLTPESLKNDDARRAFRAHQADAAIVVAYGLLLPRAVLDAPAHGCLNLHASLLPRWRGAAPIQRAVMAGDCATGVSIMRMDEGLDTGPVCLVERVMIGDSETAGALHDRLAPLGADLMVRAMAALARDGLDCVPQPDKGVVYAEKIGKAETRIDWSRSSSAVHDHIRGLSPWPGAWFDVDGARIKVLASVRAEGEGTAGTVLDDRLTIACGEGAVRLLRLQRQGKGPLETEAFLRGMAIEAGTVLA